MRFHDFCAFSHIFGNTSHDAEGELTRDGVERHRFVIDRGRVVRGVRSTSGAESRVDGRLVFGGGVGGVSGARRTVRWSRRRRRASRARDVATTSRVISRCRAFESAHHLAKRAHFLGHGGDFLIHRLARTTRSASRRRRRGTRRSRGISRTRVLVVFRGRDARGSRRRRRLYRRRRRSR